MSNHRLIDERSLAFGRAIAARLAEQPELIDLAHENLIRWLQTCSPRLKTTLREWLDMIEGPPERVLEVLTGSDERSIRLRQSNPFAGALPQDQRNAILRQFQRHDPPTA